MSRAAAAALAAGLALLASPAAADPRTDYILHCQGCHLPDGGETPGAVPALRGLVATFLSIPGGREYLIRVPGTAQADLSDARIASLLDWILLELDPARVPEDFEPYTAEEVARARARPLKDALAERRRLLGGAELR